MSMTRLAHFNVSSLAGYYGFAVASCESIRSVPRIASSADADGVLPGLWWACSSGAGRVPWGCGGSLAGPTARASMPMVAVVAWRARAPWAMTWTCSLCSVIVAANAHGQQCCGDDRLGGSKARRARSTAAAARSNGAVENMRRPLLPIWRSGQHEERQAGAVPACRRVRGQRGTGPSRVRPSTIPRHVCRTVDHDLDSTICQGDHSSATFRVMLLSRPQAIHAPNIASARRKLDSVGFPPRQNGCAGHQAAMPSALRRSKLS